MKKWLAAVPLAAVLALSTGSVSPQSRPGNIEVDQPSVHVVPAPLGAETSRPGTVLMQPEATPARMPLRPREQGVPDVRERLEPRQNVAELIKTTLLNRFGGLGFAELGSLSLEGDHYAAEVKTVDGRWVIVVIDPRTGEIVSENGQSSTRGQLPATRP